MTRVYEYVTWCTIYKYISQVRKISLQVHEHFVTPIHKSPKECKINHSNHAIFPPLKHTIWDHFQYKCLICPWPHAIHKTEDHIQSKCNKCKVMAVCSPTVSAPLRIYFPFKPFYDFFRKKRSSLLVCPSLCQQRLLPGKEEDTKKEPSHTSLNFSLSKAKSDWFMQLINPQLSNQLSSKTSAVSEPPSRQTVNNHKGTLQTTNIKGQYGCMTSRQVGKWASGQVGRQQSGFIFCFCEWRTASSGSQAALSQRLGSVTFTSGGETDTVC